ncbi:MAG: hypothetical protein ACP5EN_06590 [Rhodovulum sp.]
MRPRLSRRIAGFAPLIALAAAPCFAADDLPRRLLVSGMFYNAPGVGPNSMIPEALGGGPEPVPDAVAALGLTTGAPMRNFFARFGWPWLVLEDGDPVGFAIDRGPSLPARLPDSRTLDSLAQDEDVRELFYRRDGDRVGFRVRYHDAGPYGLGPEHDVKGYGVGIFEGTAAPDRAAGCFRIETYWSMDLYAYGSSALFQRAYDELPYGKARVCLTIDETSVLPDGSKAHRLKAQVTGTFGRRKTESLSMDRTGYFVGVAPAGEAPAGAYLAADGAPDFHAETLVEDINRFAAALEGTIARHDFDLAARQVASLNAYLADLDAEGVAWHWTRRPTAAGVARYNALMQGTETYRLAHLDTQARLNDVRGQLEILRTNFSGNVVKSMLKSTINWLDMVPTDPLSGLAGYSDIAGALLLPRTLKGWKETAESDSAMLASQVTAIRRFETLEQALAQRLDEITEARRALFQRIRDNDEARVVDLDAALRRN